MAYKFESSLIQSDSFKTLDSIAIVQIRKTEGTYVPSYLPTELYRLNVQYSCLKVGREKTLKQIRRSFVGIETLSVPKLIVRIIQSTFCV